LPEGIRLARWAPAPAARRVGAPGPDAARAVSLLPALLLAGHAPHGVRPRPAPRDRRRRKPGRVRATAARPGGPRACRPTARRRDLHGRSRRPEPHGTMPPFPEL